MKWFALRTEYAQEERAQRNLQQQDYETLLPLARVESRRKNGLLVARTRPLFRGYIFAAVRYRQPWQPMANTFGIAGFVGYVPGMQMPPVVRDRDIEELCQRIKDAGGMFHMGLSRPQDITAGMICRVLFGPFRDETAIVQVDLGSRVQALLQVAGWLGEIPIKLSKECLTAA